MQSALVEPSHNFMLDFRFMVDFRSAGCRPGVQPCFPAGGEVPELVLFGARCSARSGSGLCQLHYRVVEDNESIEDSSGDHAQS